LIFQSAEHLQLPLASFAVTAATQETRSDHAPTHVARPQFSVENCTLKTRVFFTLLHLLLRKVCLSTADAGAVLFEAANIPDQFPSSST